eukprot:5155449-Prymnesium_polylepis.1
MNEGGGVTRCRRDRVQRTRICIEGTARVAASGQCVTITRTCHERRPTWSGDQRVVFIVGLTITPISVRSRPSRPHTLLRERHGRPQRYPHACLRRHTITSLSPGSPGRQQKSPAGRQQ